MGIGFAALTLAGLFIMLFMIMKKLPYCLYQVAWFGFGALLFSVMWMFWKGMLRP